MTALLIYGVVGVIIMICLIATNFQQFCSYIYTPAKGDGWDTAESRSVRHVISHESREDWEEKFAKSVGQRYVKKPFDPREFERLMEGIQAGTEPKALSAPSKPLIDQYEEALRANRQYTDYVTAATKAMKPDLLYEDDGPVAFAAGKPLKPTARKVFRTIDTTIPYGENFT